MWKEWNMYEGQIYALLLTYLLLCMLSWCQLVTIFVISQCLLLLRSSDLLLSYGNPTTLPNSGCMHRVSCWTINLLYQHSFSSINPFKLWQSSCRVIKMSWEIILCVCENPYRLNVLYSNTFICTMQISAIFSGQKNIYTKLFLGCLKENVFSWSSSGGEQNSFKVQIKGTISMINYWYQLHFLLCTAQGVNQVTWWLLCILILQILLVS